MFGNFLTLHNNLVYYVSDSYSYPLILLVFVSLLGYYYYIFHYENAGDILFFNDLHYQYKYNPYGSPQNHCFSNSTNFDGFPSLYGIYGCNSPSRLVHSFFDFLKTRPKPSMIIFGGDSVSLPEKTDKAYLEWMDYFMSTLSNIFPSTPVLMTLGNNEFLHNYGSFDTDHHDFHLFAQGLSPYLKSDQIETIKQGGYYSQDFSDQKLRVIILNTVMYLTKMSRKNHNETDPWGQFSWLESVVKDARRKNYEIILSMHAPPNALSPEKPKSGWNPIYLNQFASIIKKYDIHQILVGHSHLDLVFPIYSQEVNEDQTTKLEVKFSPDNQTENNLVLAKEDGFIALSSPSISPKHGNNPAFRVYKLRKGKVYDYDQYYTDISTLKYQYTQPEWKKHYSFLNTYQIKDFGAFHDTIANSPEKKQIYLENMWVKAAPYRKHQ